MSDEHLHQDSAPGHPLLRCETCGERIGIYERLTCRLPDGSVLTSGFLVLAEQLRGLEDVTAFFHAACF